MKVTQHVGAIVGAAAVLSGGLAAAPGAAAETVAPGTAATNATPSTGQTSIGTIVTRYTYSSPYTQVRAAAKTTAPSVGKLSAGQTVTGTVSGSWLQVVTPSQYAGKFISLTVLSDQQPTTSGCLSPSAHVKLGVGYPLCLGTTGVKVRLVREALGLRVDSTVANGTYDSSVADAVTRFQKTHHLYPTGRVDATTYRALQQAFPSKRIARYGFDIDGWVNTPSASLPKNASRTQRIQAMLSWADAQKRAGMPYVWGGTGTFGYDCSGFVLQAMRAGGRNPKNVSNWTDVRPQSDLSRQLWGDKEFAKGSLARPQVGDFVYYGTRAGVVSHVSIYVGHNTVINAVGDKVKYSSYSTNFGWARKIGINRAF